MSDQSDEQSGEERVCPPEGEEFKEQIRPILDQVYVYAEQVIGIESIELMLSELKGVYDVLENV